MSSSIQLDTTPFTHSAFPVTDDFVKISDFTYPITHSFVVKSTPTYPIMEYYNQFPPFIPSPWNPEFPDVEICYSVNFPSRAIRGWRFQSVQWTEWWAWRWLSVLSGVVLWRTNVGWHPHMGTEIQNLITEFMPHGFLSWASACESFDVPPLPSPMNTDYDLDKLVLRHRVFADPPFVGQSFPPWGEARPWHELEAFLQPDPPNIGAVLGLVSGVNVVWMHDWANPPFTNPPVLPPHDFVYWVRGTSKSIEWNEMAESLRINDSLFFVGQGRPPDMQIPQPRRLSDKWFWEPWKRYEHLL